MKTVNRSYKYRFYPTQDQKKQLAQSFGCCRFVYNHFLSLKKESYNKNREKINYNQTSQLLTVLKNNKDHEWLQEVSSVVLQQTLRDLDKAFSNFFAGRARYPTFKKKCSEQSVRYTKSGFSFVNGKLKIAKNKDPLNISWSRQFQAEPTSVTVSKDSADRYFVSFCVEESLEPLPKLEKMIGIDVGIQDICVTSDGVKSGSPQYLKKYQKKLAKRQRELCKKKKGSKNRSKARLKLAKVHAKIADSRNDFNNKLTTKLIRENQAIAIESLSVKNMQKNHILAKSIADASWSEFFRKLQYKGEWYGRQIVEIDRFFPSSKKCNACQNINHQLKLCDREWECPCCKKMLDREINAANNLLAAGQVVLAFGESGRLNTEYSVLSVSQ